MLARMRGFCSVLRTPPTAGEGTSELSKKFACQPSLRFFFFGTYYVHYTGKNEHERTLRPVSGCT